MLRNLFAQAYPCPCLWRGRRGFVYLREWYILSRQGPEYYPIWGCFRLFPLIFKEWFNNGLGQETVTDELVSCVISETRSIKRDWIHV